MASTRGASFDATVEGTRAELRDHVERDVAGVYHAVAHCHDHPREMRAVEDERQEAFASLQQPVHRPDGVDPIDS